MRRFKIFFFLLCFGLSVFSFGYFYLDNQLDRVYVSQRAESVPYYSDPENKGFLFDFCGDKILLYFDFSDEMVKVLYPNENFSTATDIYGYKVDYRIRSDYKLVGYLVDSVGGIELEINGETYRYTGSQITEMLEYSVVSEEIKGDIAKRIINGFSSIGFTKENLLYIIENSETDLKFSEGMLFVDYISSACKFVRLIN